MWTTIFNALKNFLISTLNVFLALFPDCPFEQTIEELTSVEWLGYLNYFIPISEMIAIASAWLVSVAAFWLYHIIYRWLKAIK